jgi:hypothetical protein
MINVFFDIKLKVNYIKVELQNRKEYIFDPETTDGELYDFNDEI